MKQILKNRLQSHVWRTEVEVRVRKIRNEKATGKSEVIGEVVKGGGQIMTDWIWKLCNMAFESRVVPEDWRAAAIVSLCKGKGERTEGMSYGGFNF